MSYSQNNPWYYAVGGQRRGPVAFADLQEKISTGEITPDTLVWSQGLADWVPATHIAELFGAPPLARDGQARAADDLAAVAPASGPASAAAYSRGGPSAGTVAHPGEKPTRQIKPVKPANFALWLGLGIVGFVAYAVALATTLAENEGLAVLAGIAIAVALLSLIASTVMGSIYIYRAWLLIQDDGIPARTTPGKAVGFLFIPLFSLYWMFVAIHGWSQDYNRLISVYEYTDAPKVPEGLFLALPILLLVSIVPGLGVLATLALLAVGPLVFYHYTKAINYFAARAGRNAL